MSVSSRPHRRAGARTGSARWAVVFGVGLVIAFPVAVWWLVGDLSTVPAANADYAFRPLPIGPAAERAVGIGSVLLVVVALSVLVWATHRHLFGRRWWIVLGLLLVADFIIGSGWRVMTAGVIGANIGAGLVVMFGGPVVVALLIGALALAVVFWSGAPPRP